MSGKDVAKTDWSDLCNEGSPHDQRTAYKNNTYNYRTKSNMSVFQHGKTNGSGSSDTENLILEIVSDSVDSRNVPMFIDYSRFSNPFMKYSRSKNSSVIHSKEAIPYDIDSPLPKNEEPLTSRAGDTKTNDTNKYDQTTAGPTGTQPGHHTLVSDSNTVNIAPEQPNVEVAHNKCDQVKTLSTPPSPARALVERMPESMDLRKEIRYELYYMSDMKLAVDSDPRIGEEVARQFKVHVVQNHQNLHEILQARNTEKPIANPFKPELPAGLGMQILNQIKPRFF